MIPKGQPFYKMSGSGNDFVMIDGRSEEVVDELREPAVVQKICARATGIGADGIVFVQPSNAAAVRLTYLNADGSRADLCGNATLCTARLAVELGMADPAQFDIETDSGLVKARMVGELPEIALPPVSDLRSDAESIALAQGERRVGYALVGVPHLVIACDDVTTVDVVGRGRPLRHHPSMPTGANVNFVSQLDSGSRWRMRTFERGVEAETLACGSGSVASAILVTTWASQQPAPGEAVAVELVTSSGRSLIVRLQLDSETWRPTLSGEARIVFSGSIGQL